MEIKILINQDIDEVKVIIESPTTELANDVFNQLSDDKPKNVFTVKNNEGVQIVRTEEIEVIEIFTDEIVISFESGEQTQFRGRLYKIKANLDDRQFVQISKSAIINLKQIRRLENSFSGNMDAVLRSGKKQSISRRYLSNLKLALEQIY
ncbi:LytTR family DNA-binding domain-containing protein [Lactobacillus sp. YT155]|uniref:LytTR family DNA-binding domain-containing protein n=1 Tax=Lactobacillus sp. YT155 TaxID=3060955 RepID=UPI00265E0372|nr:LytTR family DNA-binding domain-containing protein [Lactobacillus sp. YT155]MDO1604711.1 LytTR family DNA-binding domain-containing protein [Lactobacillus sp. YT155]